MSFAYSQKDHLHHTKIQGQRQKCFWGAHQLLQLDPCFHPSWTALIETLKLLTTPTPTTSNTNQCFMITNYHSLTVCSTSTWHHYQAAAAHLHCLNSIKKRVVLELTVFEELRPIVIWKGLSIHLLVIKKNFVTQLLHQRNFIIECCTLHLLFRYFTKMMD